MTLRAAEIVLCDVDDEALRRMVELAEHIGGVRATAITEPRRAS